MRYVPLHRSKPRVHPWRKGLELLPLPPKGIDTATWMEVCTRPFTYRLTANVGILVTAICHVLTRRLPGFGQGQQIGIRQMMTRDALIRLATMEGEHGRCHESSEDWPFEPLSGAATQMSEVQGRVPEVPQ